MKFRKEDLQNLVWGELDSDRIFEVIEDKITGTTRWSTHHTMIFRYNYRFFKVKYSHGSTEYQDEIPFQDNGDEIECEEVVPVEKTIVVFESIDG